MKRLLISLLFLSASPAMAVDGVIEINQLCVTTGCFTGDVGGSPVTLAAPGSYRLTSNLTVASENQTAIEITSDNVSLDLNGFTISGPVTCAGVPVTSCTPNTGTGDGVLASGSGRDIVIKNGHIRGMGRFGVFCSNGCTVKDIVAIENRSVGITNGNGFGRFINNTTRRNGGDGFFVSGYAESNISTDNGNRGLFANPRSTLIGNTIIGNGGNGIRCFSCNMSGNLVNANVGFGVDFGGRSAFGGNLIDANVAGEINGSAFTIAPNRCGLAACP